MVESIVAWLIVGAIAGWIAGKVVRGGGFGLLGNIVIGIIGAVVAGWLLPQLGIALASASCAPSSTLRSAPSLCWSSFPWSGAPSA